MAQAVGLLLFGSSAGISVAGITLTTAAGALTTAGAVFNLGAGLLLSAASTALFQPDLPQIGPDSIKVNTASETMPRVMHFGEVRAGYAIVFTAAKNGKLYRVIVHGQNQTSAIKQYFIDKAEVTRDVDGFVQEAQFQFGARSYLKLESRLGVVPEVPYADLLAEFPEWTANHRLDGLCTTLMVAELPPVSAINGMYPNREPSLEVVMDTQFVTDPRTGTKVYSDNLALCAYEYELQKFGGNLGDYLDDEAWSAAADACDELATIPNQAPEKKWRFAGSIDLNEEPQAVRERFAGACGGEYYITPAGKWAFRVGGYEAPTFTLTEDMLEAGGFEAEFGLGAVASYSISAFQYVEPTHKHIKISGEEYRDEDRVDLIGEVRNTPFFSSPSHRQCREAAKILMEQENPETVLQVITKPMAIEMFYERFVTVDFPKRRISGVFQVKEKGINPNNLTQRYQLSLVRKTKVELSPLELGTVPPYGGAITSTTVEAPDSLKAFGAGGATPGIIAWWDPPPNTSLTPHVELGTPFVIEVDNDTDITGINWEVLTVPEGATTVQRVGLIDGDEYFVRMAWQKASGSLGPFADNVSVTATATDLAPVAPTGLTGIDAGATTAQIDFVTSASGNVLLTQVLRDGVVISEHREDPSTAIQIFDTPLDEFGVPAPGTYDYVVRAISATFKPSPDAGPVSVTLA